MSELKLGPRRQFSPVPLSFSQLTHWRHGRFDDRPSMRNLAAVVHLRGNLQRQALQESLDCVVFRHEALRTRFVEIDGTPRQLVQYSMGCSIELEDFSSRDESVRESEVAQLIHRTTREPMSVTSDPLLVAKLARLSDSEHVLIVAMEHMICDELSVNLLVRDTLSIYHVLTGVRRGDLPAIGVQFPDFAAWQNNTLQVWLRRHGPYWRHRLAGCQRLRFPVVPSLEGSNESGWGVVPIHISPEQKRQLQEWCAGRRTNLVLTLFAMFSALVLRWCHASHAVFRFQTDGRLSPQLENTIGFFASMLHLRVELWMGDRFVDLANRVTAEYRDAYEHHDLSHTDAQLPRPEFTYNSCFNWVSHGPRINGDESTQELQASSLRFSDPLVKIYQPENEPVLLLYDGQADIRGGIHFPLSRLSQEIMNEFAAAFMRYLTVLLREPDRRIVEIEIRP